MPRINTEEATTHEHRGSGGSVPGIFQTTLALNIVRNVVFAARKEGKIGAAFGRYGDSPERNGIPAKPLSLTGTAHHLIQRLGHSDATIVGAEFYIVLTPTRNMAGFRYPDLLVSFNSDPEAYYRFIIPTTEG